MHKPWSLDEAYVTLDALISELSESMSVPLEGKLGQCLAASEFLANLTELGLPSAAAESAATIESAVREAHLSSRMNMAFMDNEYTTARLKEAEEARCGLHSLIRKFITEKTGSS